MKTEQLPPHVQLAVMSRQYVVSRAIHAIAQLGIANHMSERATPVSELARLTATTPELLERVLNFLTDYGLFAKNDNGYALTALSLPLRQDHPFSMQEVLGMMNESWWQAFSDLPTQLKTGTPAFTLQHGMDFFNFHNINPDQKSQLEQGMAKLSSFDDTTIAQNFNFGQFQKMIDVGYGRQGLIEAIANQYPALDLISFSFAPELIATHAHLFTSLPTADAYLFKGILHDFNDELAQKILIECFNNMKINASLIIAEQVIPANELPHTNKTMDIVMMVLLGGRQRTLSQWIELAQSAGFIVHQATTLPGLFTMMEFKRKSD